MLSKQKRQSDSFEQKSKKQNCKRSGTNSVGSFLFVERIFKTKLLGQTIFEADFRVEQLLQICARFCCERGLRSYSENAAQITREINFLSAATQKIRSKFRLFEKIFQTLKKMASETRIFDSALRQNNS